MRIAVLVIGLLLGLIMFVQTMLVYGLSSAVDEESTAGAGAVGVLMSLMWLVACGLVLAFPLASTALFAVAGLFGIGVGATSDFGDLIVWGVVSFVLAAMAFLGWRGKRKDAAAKLAELQRQNDRDARLEELMRSRVG